jgi:hypothetical protein
MVSSRTTLSEKQQAVLDLITNHRALISIVFDLDYQAPNGPQIDYSRIDQEYLDQLADPSKNRPSRAKKFFAEKRHPQPLPKTSKKMDMRTGEIDEDYHPATCRETKHKGMDFQHTAKTATSLIPPDPRYMELFFCDDGIGFMWDINDCDIKQEKYVFFENAGTDSCFWLDLDSDEKIGFLKQRLEHDFLATIDLLRERNIAAIKKDQPISWNEVLVGLPKGKLNAVFATQDVRSARLRALRAMQRAKEKLNLQDDFPVLILQPYFEEESEDAKQDHKPRRPGVFRFYQPQEQEADLKAELAEQQAQQASLDIIKNHNALALPILDEKMFYYYLEQLVKPGIHCQAPTSLLPPQPQCMDLGGNDGSMEFGRVGLLFDIKSCDLKNLSEEALAILRAQNDKAVSEQKIITANTVLAGLPQGQVAGVFCLVNRIDLGNSWKHCVEAQNIALQLKQKLKIEHLPIFIIQPRGNGINPVFRIYAEHEQLFHRNIERDAVAYNSPPLQVSLHQASLHQASLNAETGFDDHSMTAACETECCNSLCESCFSNLSSFVCNEISSTILDAFTGMGGFFDALRPDVFQPKDEKKKSFLPRAQPQPGSENKTLLSTNFFSAPKNQVRQVMSEEKACSMGQRKNLR